MDLFTTKVVPTVRNESSNVVNEFNLNAAISAKSKVNVAGLVDVLEKVKNVGQLKKQLTTEKKRAVTLDVPLHKQAKEKIERSVAYGRVKRKVGFWDETVRQNRLNDHLVFPLRKIEVENENENEPKQFTLDSAVEVFRANPRTELEIETAKLLQSSKNNLPKDEEYTEAEKEALKAMSLEEAERRKSELCKMRALISYKTAANKRKKAIKSKRYRRLGKKQERKVTEKEVLELLRKNDITGAKEKLELLENDRIAERSTLKHRSTGKWAKQIRMLAKKDPQLRQALQTQLKLGRELAEKVFAKDLDQNSDEDNEKGENSDQEASTNANNNNNNNNTMAKSSTRIDLTPKIAEVIVARQGGSASGNNAHLGSDDDDDNDQAALISEAFADDDVINEEVDREMAGEEDEDNLDSLDASNQMPGWNSWAGPGMMQKQRTKLKKKLAHEEKNLNLLTAKRRKRNKVFINDKANESIQKFQVQQLPFPYTKADVFEENLAQPLGKEWNSVTSYKMLIEPAVRMKTGHVIKPIRADNVLKRQNGDDNGDYHHKFSAKRADKKNNKRSKKEAAKKDLNDDDEEGIIKL